MERTQRRWSRRIYIRPAVATRPFPNSRPWPWSSVSPRSSRRRWNHRRNEPSVITIGSERRSPDAATLSPFPLSLARHYPSVSFDIRPRRVSAKWILLTFARLSWHFRRSAKCFFRLSRRDFETENRYVEWIAKSIASKNAADSRIFNLARERHWWRQLTLLSEVNV